MQWTFFNGVGFNFTAGGKCGPVELLGQQAATAILTLNSALTATNWLHFVGPTPSTQGRDY